MEPVGRRGLRTPARKTTDFGFRTQTPGPETQKRRPGRQRGLRTPSRNDVLPVNRTMKKYKIYVTSNLNFLLADF